MREFLVKYFPATYEFFGNFFGAMSNKPGSHSLKKWMGLGFFFLVVILCIKYTDHENLTSVITVLCGMITSLVITYSVSNYHDKKLTLPTNQTTTDGTDTTDTTDAGAQK